MSTGADRNSAVHALGANFDDVVLPHLDAAYRLARWLVQNKDDAEDVVQEALVRAFRYFQTFSGGNGRAWFLRIVRNACWSWRRSHLRVLDPFDEEEHSWGRQPAPDPEMLMLLADDHRLLQQALSNLRDDYRELLVLRELEELSYRELADVMDVPMGTVMSRLSRARLALRAALESELGQSGIRKRRGAPEDERDTVPV